MPASSCRPPRRDRMFPRGCKRLITFGQYPSGRWTATVYAPSGGFFTSSRWQLDTDYLRAKLRESMAKGYAPDAPGSNRWSRPPLGSE